VGISLVVLQVFDYLYGRIANCSTSLFFYQKTNTIMVSYDENALVIKIQTSDAAALHERLMNGLTDALRNFITSKTATRTDAQLALVDLLEGMLPDETQLSKAIA
jgi:hypothetical protein